MLRMCFSSAVLVLVAATGAAAGTIGCFSKPVDVGGPWKTYRANNRCNGSVTIDYTIIGPDGSKESSSSSVSACQDNALVVQTFRKNDVSFGEIRLESSSSSSCNDAKRPDRPPPPSETSTRGGSSDSLASRLAKARSKAAESDKQIQGYKTRIQTEQRDAVKSEGIRLKEVEAAKDAERQRKWAEAQRRADEARRQAAMLDAERQRRQLEDARKWQCFGDEDNAREGFEACMSACNPYYAGGTCHGMCYASSTGSVATGRSCFKSP